MELERLIAVDDLPVGELVRCVTANGLKICLARTEEGFFAIDDTCSHEASSLSEGWLDGDTVECPFHNSLFNIRTGEAMTPPAIEPVRTYALTIEDDQVFVDIGGADALEQATDSRASDAR